ncbi:MAG TPA: DMT family transporter [Mycobacteriales bacterium]|nr:DMT family transporter [Mycobacteriales bacterium]
MTTARQQRLATVGLVAVTAVWGSTFVVVKHAVTHMPVMDFLAWRFGIAAIAMAAARPRAVLTLDARGRRLGVVLGLALGGGYVAQTVGLQHTPASISGFITGLFVVFTPLCAAVLLRKRVDRMTWLAVVLATIGLGLISLRGFSIGGGEALTLLCALAFGLHIVGLGEWSSSYDAAGLAVVQLTTVAVLSIAIAAPSSLAPPPDAAVWGAVLLTAIAATALAFFIQTWAQAQLPPTRAAVVMTMEPVFAGIFGVAIGGDSLTARTVVGAVLVLVAMYTVELGPRHGKDAAVQRFE